MPTQAEKDAQIAELAARLKSGAASMLSNASLLAKAVALTVDQPAPPPVPPAPRLALGVQGTFSWPDATDAVRAQMIATAKAAGCTWVRVDVAWETFQPTGPGTLAATPLANVKKWAAECKAAGMQALLEILDAPTWASGVADKVTAPTDPRTLGDFMALLTAALKGVVGAYEVWNEPDLTGFLKPNTPATFAGMLREAYRGAKAGDPGCVVVAGGLSMPDPAWLAQLYAALGTVRPWDVMGVHGYPGFADLDVATGKRVNGDPVWTAKDDKYNPRWALPAFLKVMADNGDTRPVWVTEFGYSTHVNDLALYPDLEDPSRPGQIANWNWGVTEAQQADLVANELALFAKYPQIKVAVAYTIRNTSTRKGTQQNEYGISDNDAANTPKPVVPRMRQWLEESAR